MAAHCRLILCRCAQTRAPVRRYLRSTSGVGADAGDAAAAPRATVAASAPRQQQHQQQHQQQQEQQRPPEQQQRNPLRQGVVGWALSPVWMGLDALMWAGQTLNDKAVAPVVRYASPSGWVSWWFEAIMVSAACVYERCARM
jgi:hypothetical protein